MGPRRPSLLYRVQGAVLDQTAALGFPDRDGFAAALADLYVFTRASRSLDRFLGNAARIRTGTFAPKRRERRIVTEQVVHALDRRFLSHLSRWETPMPASKTQQVRVGRLRSGARAKGKTGRQQFDALIREFRKAIELNGVQEFWESRRKQQLRQRPESLAQVALSIFLHAPVKARNGLVLREVGSGTGYVDVLAMFGRSRLYMVELKILRSSRIGGFRQLARYLELHSLAEGWLLLFDTRPWRRRTLVSDHDRIIDGKVVNVVVIDINPPPPSSLDR